MANAEHLKMLSRGVKEWNTWREQDLDKPFAYLRGANLAKARLNKASLWNANFKDANLFRADLRGARLIYAKLDGARLREANLFKAKLGEANLRGADLTDANCAYSSFNFADLRDADLRGANLTNAGLTYANLAYVFINRANFAGAVLGGTPILGVDLSQIAGLETVTHVGPSDIATSTLERTAVGLEKNASRRGAVETFLRGAGVPEGLLNDWFAIQSSHPIEFYSCFISYSHADKSFARRLYTDLQGQGIRCWLDEKDLRPGDVMIDAITDAIRLRDKVLVCCSLASLTSGWVDQELTAAFEIERREGKKVIIPLDLDGYLFDGWEGGKAPLVRERVAADFTGWESDNAKFEEQFDRVVKALRTGDGGREAPPGSKP